MPLERIEDLSDAEIVERLTAVRGIGRWTAEMFLLFHLRRLDVWPVDDFAVRKGYGIIHGLSEAPKAKALRRPGGAVPPLPLRRRLVLLAGHGHRAPRSLSRRRIAVSCQSPAVTMDSVRAGETA